MIAHLILSLLISCSVAADDDSKETVHIGLVYQVFVHFASTDFVVHLQNYARSKAYDKAFKEAIRNINAGQSIAFVVQSHLTITISQAF